MQANQKEKKRILVLAIIFVFFIWGFFYAGAYMPARVISIYDPCMSMYEPNEAQFGRCSYYLNEYGDIYSCERPESGFSNDWNRFKAFTKIMNTEPHICDVVLPAKYERADLFKLYRAKQLYQCEAIASRA